MRSRRLLAYGLLLLLTGACGWSSLGEDQTPVAPEPPPIPERPIPSAPETLPEPTLDPTVTGRHNGDRSLTLERCRGTGWSFTGCSHAWPTQGRQWVEYRCRTETDPTIRATLCTRWGRYRIQGVGGPVEREEGIAVMRQFCEDGHALACATLSEHLVFTDVAGARRAMERGCSNPATAPVGRCNELRQITSDDASRFEASVTRATGLAGVAPGGTCRVWVVRETPTCQANVECGGWTLYGAGSGSYFPCEVAGTEVSGGEDMTTGTDNDAAFHIDSRARTLRVRDDERGPHGAFEVEATLPYR